METEAGCVPAEIKQIMRQSAQYRQAVAQLSEGHVRDAFAKLNQLGWIREAPDGERYRLLAADYVRTVEAGESALVISPTHLEAERVTNAIRDRLRTNGTLSTHERTLTVLRNANLTEGERADPAQYTSGDVLVFHQNAKGFKKGERVTVTTERPPVEQAARFMLFHQALLRVAEGDVLRVTKNGKSLEGHRLHNGDLLQVDAFDEAGRIVTREGKTLAADFGHLDYGYCVTSHQSQGSDVDRVFIGQSSASFAASSREQFYVSVSRARKQATIYTDHKAALLGAVEQTDERLSATELVQGGRMPEPSEPDRSPVVKREAPAADRQRKEDLVYER